MAISSKDMVQNNFPLSPVGVEQKATKTFPTEVEVVWALAHASLMITLPRGLKPTLQGLLSETSTKGTKGQVRRFFVSLVAFCSK